MTNTTAACWKSVVTAGARPPEEGAPPLAGALLGGLMGEPGWSALGGPALQQQLLLGLAGLAEALPPARLRIALEALPRRCQSGGSLSYWRASAAVLALPRGALLGAAVGRRC